MWKNIKSGSHKATLGPLMGEGPQGLNEILKNKTTLSSIRSLQIPHPDHHGDPQDICMESLHKRCIHAQYGL